MLVYPSNDWLREAKCLPGCTIAVMHSVYLEVKCSVSLACGATIRICNIYQFWKLIMGRPLAPLWGPQQAFI
jgi:hypothetical protein